MGRKKSSRSTTASNVRPARQEPFLRPRTSRPRWSGSWSRPTPASCGCCVRV